MLEDTLTYVHRSISERRIVFKLRDFIEYRCDNQNLIGRIENIFVHNFFREQRAFVQVGEVGLTDSRDSILSLQMLKMRNKSRIIGLPAITSRRLYIVPVEMNDTGDEMSLGGEQCDDLIWVDWAVRFL